MKRLIAMAVAVAATLPLATWGTAVWINSGSDDERLAGPRVRLPTTRANLGSVSAEMPLVARFTVHNDGDRRLIVLRDHSACCGQTEDNDATIVQPRSLAELVVAIDATRQRGRLEKTVAYSTNDRELPRFELVVSANISKPSP